MKFAGMEPEWSLLNGARVDSEWSWMELHVASEWRYSNRIIPNSEWSEWSWCICIQYTSQYHTPSPPTPPTTPSASPTARRLGHY